jgi:hypothetical protein
MKKTSFLMGLMGLVIIGMRRNNRTKMSRNFGGGTVMVQTAFGVRSDKPICWITTKMNSKIYSDLASLLVKFTKTGINIPNRR